MANKGQSIQRYPRELRERAIRLALEAIDESGEPGAITRIARQLGIHSETLRQWVRKAQGDQWRAPADIAEIEKLKQANKELERKNFELNRSNEILKSAAAFFAREIDPQSPNS